MDILLIVIGVLIAVIILLYLIFSKRCPKCGKLKAMEEISCILVNSIPTTISEKREKKDKNGKVVSSWYVDLPATKYVYEKTFRCKYCQHCYVKVKEETVKN